jgi:hypothetical protein
MEFSSIYSEDNLKRLSVAAATLIVVIAVVDWQTKPFISIGFPYLFLCASRLSRDHDKMFCRFNMENHI